MRFRTLGRLVIATAVIVGAIVGGTRLVPAAAGQEDGMGQIAGSWVWRHHLGPVGSLTALVTFDKDGTVIGASGGMFGNPLGMSQEARSAKEGPLHGAWERTGPSTFRGITLFERYDSAGIMVGFTRSRTEGRLLDRDHFAGVSYLEVLDGCVAPPEGPLGCPDPLALDAEWVPFPMMPPTGFAVTGTRIHPVPLP
jgi:hypothetical protein